MHYLYSALLTLAAVLGSPYWIYKAVNERKYLKNIRQRLGLVLPEERPLAKPLWIHAVSVGEVLAAKPLFAALRAGRPDLPAALCELLKNPRARNTLGQRAASTFRQNQGAAEATVAFLLPHIK
jgi:3-deoxy-D-manno-octulosonic-acid transferase